MKCPHRLLKRRLLQLAGGGLTDMGNALTSLPEVKFAQEVCKDISALHWCLKLTQRIPKVYMDV